MFIRKTFKKNNYLIPFLVLFSVLVTTIYHLINVYRIRMPIFYYSQLPDSSDTLIAGKFDEKNSLY
jgi:hypothetical protein